VKLWCTIVDVGLGRDAVVRTALGLLNEVGLDGLTLRRIAVELDVQAPALYWHVKNKAELLDAMAATIFDDALAGLEAPRRGESWVSWTAETARLLRGAILRYRDGARVLSGSYLVHAAGRPLELTLRTLVDAGFSIGDAARGVTALYAYVQGFTVEEQTTAPAADPGRYPLSAQAHAALTDDADARFEHGLHLVLSGLRLSRFG
jgi:TetR/AcrR family transcriptional regulator, tetracycline repressor protein